MTSKKSTAHAGSRSGHSLKVFSRMLWGVAVITTSACAGSVTPPESTPVYADEIAPGIEPIPVERTSVNRPEANVVATPKEGNGMSGDGQAIAVGEDTPPASPASDEDTAAHKGETGLAAGTEAPAAPAAEPPAEPPADPAAPKTAPAPTSATPAAKKSDAASK